MQTLITLLIVLGAAGYSVWKLAPAAFRHKLASHSGTLVRVTGASEATARRIEIKALDAAANAGGCGSCGPCKACKGPGLSDEGSGLSDIRATTSIAEARSSAD